jgi:hypothetical protein
VRGRESPLGALSEDRLAPAFEIWVLDELCLLSMEDMWGQAERAGLTEEQWFVVARYMDGAGFAEIARMKGGAVTRQAVRGMILRGGVKLLERASRNPFREWYIVYLEGVLQKKLF